MQIEVIVAVNTAAMVAIIVLRIVEESRSLQKEVRL